MLLKDESSDEPQTVDTATVAAEVTATAACVVIVLVVAVVTGPCFPPPDVAADCVPVVAVVTALLRLPSDERLVDDGNAFALTAVVSGIVDWLLLAAVVAVAAVMAPLPRTPLLILL